MHWASMFGKRRGMVTACGGVRSSCVSLALHSCQLTFPSWRGVGAARAEQSQGCHCPASACSSPRMPSHTPAGKQCCRKSPYLVSKVLDDKGFIWHTWLFKESTFIQMSIVKFLGPRVIWAFWHLWKRTQNTLKMSWEPFSSKSI